MIQNFLTRSLLFVLLFSAYCGLRSHTFLASFPHDEGLFLYCGQAWAQGEIPYRDFWDHKPPGTFFFHSVPLRFFPFSIPAVKIHECLWLSASAFVLFALLRDRFHPIASFLTLFFYIFYTSAPHTVRTGGLTEESALFFVVFSFYTILRPNGKQLWKCLLAGMSIGVAIQFRQTFVFSSLFLIGILFHENQVLSKTWWREGWARWSETWISCLAIAFGLILPEILVSLYFLFHGCWYVYIDASYLYNFFYVGPAHATKSFSEILALQWMFLRSTGPYLLAPLFALTTYGWNSPKHRWIVWPAILTFCGDAFSISLSGEYYEHYYVQAAVSIHLLLAICLDGLVNRIHQSGLASSRSISRYFSFLPITAIGLVLTLFWGMGLYQYYKDYQSILQERAESESSYAFQNEVAQAIQTLTAQTDTILLMGRDPNSVYILSHRYAGSRYFHYSPLWKEKLEKALTPFHIEAFISDLQTRKPSLLLLDRRVYEKLMDGGDFMIAAHQYMQENYLPLEEVIDHSPEEIWFWYGSRLTFWIRKDQTQFVQERFLKQFDFKTGS